VYVDEKSIISSEYKNENSWGSREIIMSDVDLEWCYENNTKYHLRLIEEEQLC
jgi:hypothetical protein